MAHQNNVSDDLVSIDNFSPDVYNLGIKMARNDNTKINHVAFLDDQQWQEATRKINENKVEGSELDVKTIGGDELDADSSYFMLVWDATECVLKAHKINEFRRVTSAKDLCSDVRSSEEVSVDSDFVILDEKCEESSEQKIEVVQNNDVTMSESSVETLPQREGWGRNCTYL